MVCVGSDIRGMSGTAIPPSEHDISDHALCEINESTEHATTSVFNALNSDTFLFSATNSLEHIWELQKITVKLVKKLKYKLCAN